MIKREVWFFTSLTVTFCVIILLISGSHLLTKPLDKANTIPLGTFITWSGMISLSLTIYWASIELRNPTRNLTKILSKLLKATLILAVFWVPISYLLAGNLSFTFSERDSFQGGQTAMKWFWRLSYGIGITNILVLFTYWISVLFKK